MPATARSHRRRAHTLRSRRRLTAIGVPSAMVALVGVAFAAAPAIAANPGSNALPFPTVCSSTQSASSAASAKASSSSASPSASATSSTPTPSATASAKAQTIKTTAPATTSSSTTSTTSTATGTASASASPSASASSTGGGFWGWLNGVWTWILGSSDTTTTTKTVAPATAARTSAKVENVAATTSSKASASASSKSTTSSRKTTAATTSAASPSATTSSAVATPTSSANCISSASAAALAAKAAANGTAEGVYANAIPWVMKTSVLTMYDLTFNGVKTVQVWNGSAYGDEQVLDFTASKLTIESMITYSIQNGQTVYNNAGSGTTTTLINPHLMVTKMTASLFGLIPQTYTPTNLPPLPVGLTVPLIPVIFTGVTTQLAYLHTDSIAVPGFDGFGVTGTASPE